MKDFKSLLNRITTALGSDAHLKSSVQDVVKEYTGGNVSDKDIQIKDGNLYLTASPVLKNEVKLKEEKILGRVKEKSGLKIQRIIYC
jgi:uncharacterized cupredoxin-like copper-binding protein